MDNKPKLRLCIYNFKWFANTRQWWHDATTKTIYSMRSVQNCIATKTKIQLYFLIVQYVWKYKTNSKWFGSFNKKSHKQGCISWLYFKKYNLVFGFLQAKYKTVTALLTTKSSRISPVQNCIDQKPKISLCFWNPEYFFWETQNSDEKQQQQLSGPLKIALTKSQKQRLYFLIRI